MVIAYLMRLRRWRLNESYKWVQERRPTINLSAGVQRPHTVACPAVVEHSCVKTSTRLPNETMHQLLHVKLEPAKM